MHGTQNLELNFEKFNRSTGDSNFGFSDQTSCQKRHGLDRVFARIIFHILINALLATHYKCRGANSLNFNPEILKEETNVLHHVVRRSTDDGSLTRIKCSGHENIFCHCIATLNKHDTFARFVTKNFLINLGLVKTGMGSSVDI